MSFIARKESLELGFAEPVEHSVYPSGRPGNSVTFLDITWTSLVARVAASSRRVWS